MAVGSGQVTVTSTPTLLAKAPPGSTTGPVAAVWLLPDAAQDVYLGGSSVSSSNGLKLLHSTTLFGPITLYPGDSLYAVTSSSATVSVLQT